jgi:hypothetical protein
MIKDLRFKKELLNNFLIVEKPGTYTVKVRHNVLNSHIPGDNARYLVNLWASTIEDLDEVAREIGRDDDISYSALNGRFFTGALWETDYQNTSKLPIKGESVIAVFDLNDSGVLRCTNVVPIPREKLGRFNISRTSSSESSLLQQLLEHG